MTGEPDAGNPLVRFGGRGGANQCAVPTPILGDGIADGFVRHSMIHHLNVVALLATVELLPVPHPSARRVLLLKTELMP